MPRKVNIQNFLKNLNTFYVGKKDLIESKNLRGLIDRIEKYIDFLKNNEEFDTEFIDVGDGISVSKRKNEK